MADCCSNSSGFPNASNMQQLATNLPVVWEEICNIQQAILAASSQCQIGGGKTYAVVDGNSPMTFVSGVDTVTVLNGGAGYVTDTPTAVFVPPIGSSATGATATVVSNGGSILGVTVTNAGSGYGPRPTTLSVTSLSGTGAVLNPLVDASGKIVAVDIAANGTNYTVNDTVIATRAVAANPAYVPALLQIASVSLTGQITSVIVRNPGSGYQDSVTTVKIVSSLNNSLPYPTGVAFDAMVITNAGAVSQVIVTNQGAGYADYAPYMIISDSGTGAKTKVNLTAGSVSSIIVVSPGSNYTPSAIGSVANPITAPASPTTPATVIIKTSVNTHGTDPVLYYQVWAGLTTNPSIQTQLNSVLSYFKSLGYAITIQSNPASANTIQWRITW